MGDERDRRHERHEGEQPPEGAVPDPEQDREHRFSGDDESREGAAGASETRTPGMGA